MRNKLVSEGDKIINLGTQGENNAVEIQFSLIDRFLSLPKMNGEYRKDGKFEIWAKRNGDQKAYRVDNSKVDKSTIYWTVSSKDTAVPGIGTAIIYFRTESELIKSKTWYTFVKKDTGGTNRCRT